MTDSDKILKKEELIEKLEKEAERLHNSTRTDFPFLSPLHNYLRLKSPLYYHWSQISSASTIHIAGVLGFLVSILFFILLQILLVYLGK